MEKRPSYVRASLKDIAGTRELSFGRDAGLQLEEDTRKAKLRKGKSLIGGEGVISLRDKKCEYKKIMRGRKVGVGSNASKGLLRFARS